MSENLAKAMTAWRAGSGVDAALKIAFSTSQRCAFGIAAARSDVLPEPYDTPGRAWLRLCDEQREAVRKWNVSGAEDAERLAPGAFAEGVANHGGPLPGSPGLR